MKQGLQLRLSQQLAMTPQLQQAIRLLQLLTLELQQELQQALEICCLSKSTLMKKSTPAKRKTVKRWTPPTRSNKKRCRKSCRSMPVGTPLDRRAHDPAPAVTTLTMSCRSIRAKRRRPCRIT
ncbi:hypothetical protein ACLBR5_06255 [Escherichia coli]